MKSDILACFYKIKAQEVSSHHRPLIHLTHYYVPSSDGRRCFLGGAQRSGNFVQYFLIKIILLET